MEHQELIEYGKKAFNFSPNERFESIEQILKTAKKNIGRQEYYLKGASCLAEVLAIYVDKTKTDALLNEMLGVIENEN